MLCQAILSAVVVTCTSSCIHANDLICVMILNGIEKDDLEPSVLKKLQRHKVNIDGLNNDEQPRKCKNFNLDDINKKIDTSHTTVKNKALTNTAKVYETLSHEDILPEHPSEKHISHDDTKKMLAITTEHKIIYKDEIEYADGKPKIESVLKFWNSYVNPNKTGREATSHQPVIIDDIHDIQEKENNENDQKIKRNVNKDKKVNITGIINKIRTSDFLEKYKMDTQLTTPRNVYQEMLSSDRGFIKTFKSNELQHNKYNLENILDKIASNKDPISDQKDGEIYSPEDTTNYPYMSFKDMLAAIEYKTAYPFSDKTYKNKNTFETILPKNKISTDFYEDTIIKPINNFSNHIVKDQSQMFSIDIIKDIADNVKTFILKDLRKAIQSTIATRTKTMTTTPTSTTTTPTTTTPTTTTPTTTTQTTTTPTITTPTTITPTITTPTTLKHIPNYTSYNTETKKVKPKIPEYVFNKFMEFWEQMNNMKTKSPNINQDVKNFDDTENVHKNISSVTTKLAPISTQQFKTLNIDIEGEVPLLSQPQKYFFGPQEHKTRSILQIQKQKKSVRMHDPITIQTNAIEIPPLGMNYNIPLSHNMIVRTTSPPNRVSKNEKYIAYNSVGDTYIDTNLNHAFGSYVGSNAINRPYEVGSKATYCSTHRCIRTNSRKPHTNEHLVNYMKYVPYKDINSNRYRAFSDFSIGKKPNTYPYREDLEQSNSELDASMPKLYADCCNEKRRDMNQSHDCCALKIPSRAQVSLNPTKKVAYDETHFKKFLTSQQKVTEILERILAVKNKVRSVESL